MANRSLNERLAMVWREDRPAAIEIVSKSITKHKGNLTAVARELNINTSTIFRWVEHEAALQQLVRKMRIEAIRQG